MESKKTNENRLNNNSCTNNTDKEEQMKSSNLQIGDILSNSLLYGEKVKNIKSKERLETWFNKHNFSIKKSANSDIVKFLLNCPLSNPPKSLTIHNTRFTDNEVILVLKVNFNTICFNLTKLPEGYRIKTSKFPAWIYDNNGTLVKRVEHKKVKMWLEDHGFNFSNLKKTPLEKFLETCYICHTDKPLRFHRGRNNVLDLQCGCINYFKLSLIENKFIATHRSRIIKIFDINGEEV